MTVKTTFATSGAPAAAVTVKVDVPPAVTVAGTNAPVTPLGRSCTLSWIVSAAPFVEPVVTVYGTLAPRSTFCDGGVTEIEKSFAPQFGYFTVATRVSHLPMPVTLTSSLVYQKVQSSLASTVIAL